MSDDRFTRDCDPDDEANANDPRAPYVDRTPRPGVRPAATQPDRRGPPTPEEIAAFVATEFGGEKTAAKKKLLRPPGWDGKVEATEPVTDPEDFER